MPANVETMFYVRVVPWHGLGVRVESALNSQEALIQSGLDWKVVQPPVMTNALPLNHKCNTILQHL